VLRSLRLASSIFTAVSLLLFAVATVAVSHVALADGNLQPTGECGPANTNDICQNPNNCTGVLKCAPGTMCSCRGTT
jgi:hypothetical protein